MKLFRSLLVAAVLLSVTSPCGAADSSAIQALVESNAAAVKNMSARRIASLTAIAEVAHILDYFKAPESERKERLVQVKTSLKHADMGSELCLIDNQGAEHLRVVNGRFAFDRELSKAESDAPFFSPGMTLASGQSYTSDAYLSPDVMEWVVGFVVPVIPGVAVLHYEYPIKEYSDILRATKLDAKHFVLVVDRAGHVIADSREAHVNKAVDPLTNPIDYFPSIRRGEGALPAEVAHDVLSGNPGEAEVNWRGGRYRMAWQTTDGLIIAAFEEAR
ncbi:MAG: cache domain-containing protein [Magnetococcales bacterium]|nr:cache domain-containing protein [Magnetococcales bacterium]